MSLFRIRPAKWAALLLIILFISSCTRTELPDLNIYYKVTTDSAKSGLAIFTEIQKKSITGTFYQDEGRLFSSPINVSVTRKGKVTLMEFPDHTVFPFSFEPYVNPAPAYQSLPVVRNYVDSLYRVESDSVVYAHTQGYYSSYPCAHTDKFHEIYFRKLGELDPLRFRQRLSRFLDFLPIDISDFFSLQHMKDLDLDMDIYQPVGDSSPIRPLVVFVHGGAFFNGDKGGKEFVDWCTHFAARGYVAASVNYRLGYDGTAKQVQEAGYRAVQDVRAAIRYLLTRTDLRIDKNRIFVAGTSAGAITALNVAFMEEKDIPEKAQEEGELDAIAPEYTEHFTVRAVGNLWGAVLDPSMIDHERTDIISFHNVYDNYVPYGKDVPFDILFEGNLKNLKGKMFGVMHGSQPITVRTWARGSHAELNTYKIKESVHQQSELHSLHYNIDGQINSRFKEIEDKLTSFFSEETELNPARLIQDGQMFTLSDTTDIQNCFWLVKGGRILEYNRYSVRVLMFPDSPLCSVNVNGTYSSTGMTFCYESCKYDRSGYKNESDEVDLGLSVIWSVSDVGTDSAIETGDRFSPDEIKQPDFLYTRKGSQWRLPSVEELKELVENCILEEITTPYGTGILVTSKVNGHSMILPQYRKPGTGVFPYSYACSEYRDPVKSFNLHPKTSGTTMGAVRTSPLNYGTFYPVRAVRDR